jgi:hypothetical protein
MLDAMPVVAASRCGLNVDDRPKADLESGFTDGRRNSNAIEHLAAPAAASSRKRRRRWPVAILINFSGSPTGPTPSERPPNEPRKHLLTSGFTGIPS